MFRACLRSWNAPPHSLVFTFFAFWCVSLGIAKAAETYQILPEKLELVGPHALQRVVVERLTDGQPAGDVTGSARLSLSSPDIVRLEEGVLSPVGDGEVTLTAEVDGQRISSRVVVRQSAADEPWSFRHDVQTVLTRAGCNMGACHGAQAGKKNFKLALRGYDHEMDFNTLTRQAKGRRINRVDPAKSLLLVKGAGEVPHGGGTRFEPESLEYRIVSEWIAQGAPAPSKTDATVVNLEVLPRQVTLTGQGRQQMLVQATYSDGRKRDVTHWAKYTSTEAGVATVDEEGVVSVAGRGETAITVWFASKVAVANVSVPFDQQGPAEVCTQSPRRNFIDELVLAKLQRLNIPPSGPASDSEFLRRAHLDVLGVLPTVEETRAFLADSSPDKRDLLIDALLTRPEFVDYWSYKWSDLLLVSTKKLKGPAVWSFYNWIRDAVADNRPWDEFARQVLTAQGSTLENGAANYFVLHKDPKVQSEATTVTFLGLSVGCAQCHDHPLERWTLDDYYGLANLFARVRTKDTGVDGESVVFSVEAGNIKHPTRIGTPLARPLDGEALADQDPRDRRAHLAKWLTAPENPYFAKALANRVWANFMGRGLVEMVDDLRATNPPTNGELLDALAAHFVQSGYNVRDLIRTAMRSQAYQRTAAPLPGNAADDRFYSHFLVKRMSAEVLLDALSQVTRVPTEFPDYPKGLRALQLPDNNVTSYFLSAFGRPAREFSCECERNSEPNITQTLHLANGKTLNDKLKSADNVLKRWIDEGVGDEELIARIYLGSLSRAPTVEESQRLTAALAEVAQGVTDPALLATAKREALEDVMWAVLTSKEFLFVH
ncbi:MAG: DUF1553 domain-containing protein [Planctomycetota bacterium]|nr:DUF1553 domain-containing protein [Planctomycetota bacterium]